MASILLAVIYLTFIALGLPDSLLGAAWPAMHVDLGAPVASQSVVSIIISCGTIVSSLLTAQMAQRLGTGRLTAISVALTAFAITGFSFTSSLWQVCLLAVPYGLGAGSIDAALNNYVALHYGARHMSWLHCCWGIGASVGPLVMSWALTGPASWHGGYLAIGAIQALITAALLISLPLWKASGNTARPSAGDAKSAAREPGRIPTNRELLKLPGARATVGSFAFYCALESSVMLWMASYLTAARGTEPSVAASIVAQFYVGITAGRFVSGVVANRIGSGNQIRIGQALVALGLCCLLAFEGTFAAGISVLLIGLGCAPIYPSIIALTPKRFGEEASQGLVSLQMAFAYAGSMLVPPFFGIVAGAGDAALIPFMAAALLAANVVLAERAARTTGRRAQGR